MADKSNIPSSSSRGRGWKHRLSAAGISSSSTIRSLPPASSTIPAPPFHSPPHTTTVICSPGATFSPPLYSGPPIQAPAPIMYNIPPPTYATSPTVHSLCPQSGSATIPSSSPHSSTGTIRSSYPQPSGSHNVTGSQTSDGRAVLMLDGEG